jgi:choloylglycine hydrolase
MCFNFKTKQAKDGTVVVGRSLEFPMDMPTALAVLPPDFAGSAQVPEGDKAGISWSSRFGIVGMCAFGHSSWLVDGMNTEGLSAHFLYMPGGYCTYQAPKGDGTDISELDLISFLLGTCGSISDVKEAMESLNVIGLDPGMGFAPPIHTLLHDEGASVAIELHPDGVQVVDNPTSIGTNAPFLEWHLENLKNYVGMESTNPAAQDFEGVTEAPFGQGQGLLGLPGDYSPPSRFVRAFILRNLSDQPTDGLEAEQMALHILNAFDIVPGTIKEMGPGGSLEDEVTVWGSICNLTQKRYAYRPMTNPTTFVVNLDAVDFTKPARTAELEWKGQFVETTI